MRAALLTPFLLCALAMLPTVAGGLEIVVQVPEGLRSHNPPKVDRDSVYLENLGKQTLRFQYWSPDGEKWVVAGLESGEHLTVRCPKCDQQLKLLFHDGTADRPASLDLGAPYIIYWDSNRWKLGPYGPRVEHPIVARADPGPSWVAFAVSANGRVFMSGVFNSEGSARAAARNECEQTSGRTCRDTISVPDHWSVVVVRCGNHNFLGASTEGIAYHIALEKAAAQGFSADRCGQIATY